MSWIPHCIDQCERTDIPAGRGDGGLDNFIEAAKALRGEPFAAHRGDVFSNAWVHQTVESMSLALVDPLGDQGSSTRRRAGAKRSTSGSGRRKLLRVFERPPRNASAYTSIRRLP